MIRERLESQLPPDLTAADRFAAERDLHEAARIQAKRERWGAGEWPESYKHRLPFLSAKCFVYALDTLGKALAQLVDIPGAPDLNRMLAAWNQDLPDLVHVRDSAHHAEDRVRGKRHNKSIELKPIQNEMIDAPGGGVLIVDALVGSRYGGTLGDGRYGEVDVSSRSLAAAQKIVQDTLNSFQWRGPVEHRPR